MTYAQRDSIKTRATDSRRRERERTAQELIGCTGSQQEPG
jgi:hypothetical protein